MVAARDIDLGPVVLRVATRAGPRVLGCTRPGRPALFADLPHAVLHDGMGGTYPLLGGHRLWRAPEEPATTYLPDDEGLDFVHVDDGIELVGTPDRDGITKRIHLRQAGDLTVVDHQLVNDGTAPVRTTPWAITQLTTGGTAILPQPVGDPDAALPDRSLVLWPYTDLGDPEVRFVGDTIRVDASQRPSRCKVGFANRRGWLAYHHGTQLFVKWGPLHDDDAPHVDRGSTAECYRDERFLELETLGPVADLEPGAAVHHRETWLLRDVAPGELEDVLAALPATPPGGDP